MKRFYGVLTESNAKSEVARVLSQLSTARSAPMDGRGIVICAGGIQYFLCAWVCINMLRWHGCTLPIELWHLGSEEINDTMRQLVAPLAVECVDAGTVRQRHYVRHLSGRELSAYALLHTRFREVLSLHADNVPTADPTYLFDAPEYHASGAIIWPDIGRIDGFSKIWQLTDIAPSQQPAFDAGQILFDRARCGRATMLNMWFHEQGNFWYNCTRSSAEIWQAAWLKSDTPFAMPSQGPHAISATTCQHDFSGRRIFQHRSGAKWSIRRNRHIRGFDGENACIYFIEKLLPHWKDFTGVGIFHPTHASTQLREIAHTLQARHWIFHQAGNHERPMGFRLDGTIGQGANMEATFWDIHSHAGESVLDIQSHEKLSWRLKRGSDGIWHGTRDSNDQAVELRPKSQVDDEEEFIMSFFGAGNCGYFLNIGEEREDHDTIAQSLQLEGWCGFFIESDCEQFRLLNANYHGIRNIEVIHARLNCDRLPDGDSCTMPNRDDRSAHDADANNIRHISTSAAADLARNNLCAAPALSPGDLAVRIGSSRVDFLAIGRQIRGATVIESLIQTGIRARLIYWTPAHHEKDLRRVEKLLTEEGYVQVFHNDRARAWAEIPTMFSKVTTKVKTGRP